MIGLRYPRADYGITLGSSNENIVMLSDASSLDFIQSETVLDCKLVFVPCLSMTLLNSNCGKLCGYHTHTFLIA